MHQQCSLNKVHIGTRTFVTFLFSLNGKENK